MYKNVFLTSNTNCKLKLLCITTHKTNYAPEGLVIDLYNFNSLMSLLIIIDKYIIRFYS